MGLRSRVLGQANAGERADGHMWGIGRVLERPPRFRGKTRDTGMLLWARRPAAGPPAAGPPATGPPAARPPPPPRPLRIRPQPAQPRPPPTFPRQIPGHPHARLGAPDWAARPVGSTGQPAWRPLARPPAPPARSTRPRTGPPRRTCSSVSPAAEPQHLPCRSTVLEANAVPLARPQPLKPTAWTRPPITGKTEEGTRLGMRVIVKGRNLRTP